MSMGDGTVTDVGAAEGDFERLLAFLSDELGSKSVREVHAGLGRTGIRSIEVVRGGSGDSFMESWIPLISDAFGAEVLTHNLTYLVEVPSGASE